MSFYIGKVEQNNYIATACLVFRHVTNLTQCAQTQYFQMPLSFELLSRGGEMVALCGYAYVVVLGA